jgi:cysteine synthase A
MTMLDHLDRVGNTPMISIRLDGVNDINLIAKLEYYNPTGSVKDRAAHYILKELLDKGVIDHDTIILESTSGNFGVALATFCRYYGFEFIAVVDPNISAMNEMLIRSQGARIVKVTQRDQHGGYLLTRIQKIGELKSKLPNCYWVNQYENRLNARAYYHGLGGELCRETKSLDYLFLGVSSGGTITGVSQRVVEKYPQAKVIAVDIDGSLIFRSKAKRRSIPGIGSSMVPGILKDAVIHDVVIVDELSSIDACHELLEKHGLFVGGSSGSVISGIRKYFSSKKFPGTPNVVTIFPDRGERYYDTIYNPDWRTVIYNHVNHATINTTI